MEEEQERLRADVQELARVLRSGLTGVYAWNGVKTTVGRKLDALDALLAEVERLARITAHVGEPATVERIKEAHSALALRWLGDVPGNPHGAYKQAHGEECFICTLLRSLKAAEREVERLAGERDEAFALLKEAYPGDFDHPNRWRIRVEKLGAWPVRR